METINRLLINIITQQLSESALFYTKFFDFDIDFESDWFIHLVSKDKSLELGLINQDSEVIPKGMTAKPSGFYLTFVIDNVDEVFKKINLDTINVLKAPHDTFYGQRRLLIKDMNGVVLDISSPINGE